MKKRSAVISVAQIKYFEKNTNHNLETILKFIRIAKKNRADIVCFPESCLYRVKTLRFDDKLLKSINEECRKNSIWAIIVEDVQIKKEKFNLALLINRDGKIVGNYKKMHLYGDVGVRAGKKTRVFKTDFGKIGIVICWDIAFPELFKKMKKAGAEVVFCPSLWWHDSPKHETEHKKRELKILRALLMARAYENVFFVALCNPVMDFKHQVSYSAIASPTRIMKEIINKEGLITAKVNFNEIKKVEDIYNK
jgi:predicted amidohydrolase